LEAVAMKLGLALLRALAGGLLIGHGTQKLFGWFGGHGPEATGQAFEGMGLVPGRRNAVLAGAAEAGGGALLALGLLTPLAAAGVTGAMTTAVRKVHAPNGPWVANGGWEYNAVLIATGFAIVDVGPGPLSLDHALLGRERWGTGWALAAVGAGIAASELVIKAGSTNAVKAPQVDEAAPGDAPQEATTTPAQ
jgi:putative oxidoreductase